MALPPFLEARGITKRFPGVLALHSVDLDVHAGEVVAVIGENGAGKSTLMKILAGIHQSDAGNVTVDGEPVQFHSPREAADAGIVLIHQELSLLPNLSVGANIFLGREPHRAGWVRQGELAAGAEDVLARIGLGVPVDQPVAALPIGQRQLLEIARALAVRARLIIMDEPTSSLSEHEAERLFAVIEELKASGVAVLYVSHRLKEVEAIADRVVVLMDGKKTAELTGKEIGRPAMVSAMVGRDLDSFYARTERPRGECVLEVEGAVTEAWPGSSISLRLHAGEIVGLAGLVGCGRTALLCALFGIDPLLAGQLRVHGQLADIRSPQDALRAGIALVPEDRAQQGLILAMQVEHNLTLAALSQAGAPILPNTKDGGPTGDMMHRLGIDRKRSASAARLLSGGNQQKVVLGKWLLTDPRILLLDEPTRGIDVGAKQEIYRNMEELAESGMAILFASSEMDEVLGIADRVLVMHEGRVSGSLCREELTEEAIMHLATDSGEVAA